MEVMPACTNAGGISELVKDGVNGVVVPVASPLTLADKLQPFLDNPAMIKELGKQARHTVMTEFSMEKMVGEIETIYRESIKQ
jgi:glycosyltransferase involved in cell wall biosynthesis